MPVYEDDQLTDPVVKVIEIEAVERQKDGPARERSDIDVEATRALGMARVTTVGA